MEWLSFTLNHLIAHTNTKSESIFIKINGRRSQIKFTSGKGRKRDDDDDDDGGAKRGDDDMNER